MSKNMSLLHLLICAILIAIISSYNFHNINYHNKRISTCRSYNNIYTYHGTARNLYGLNNAINKHRICMSNDDASVTPSSSDAKPLLPSDISLSSSDAKSPPQPESSSLSSDVPPPPTTTTPIATTTKTVAKKTIKKLLPLGLMLFFILFNYTILRDTKDVLVITAPNSGAEIIPFLKTYVNLPSAIAFTIMYSNLCNMMSPDKVFYVVMSSFIAFFGAFAGLICKRTLLVLFIVSMSPLSISYLLSLSYPLSVHVTLFVYAVSV